MLIASQLKKNELSLKRNFNFFFCKAYNMFLIKGLKGFMVFRLPCIYYYKHKNINQLFFILFSVFFFKSFLKLFLNCNKISFLIFTFKLKMKGLGFRIRKLSTMLYKFFFTSVNFFYLHVPKNIILKNRKRRLFFLSLNFWILRTVIVHMLLLKKLIIYRIRGLIYPRQIFIMKPGKKRF